MSTEPKNLTGFYATTVRRPIGLLVVLVTLILVGTIAYARIPITMLPNGLSGTRLTVWVNHPGSSAEENAEKVSRVLEEQFRTLPELENIFSNASENSVMLRVFFGGDTDIDLAKAELRDRIERARPEMPDTVDRIYVWANDDGDLPVMFLAILEKERSAETDYLVEHLIQRRIEAVDGVSRMQVWGLLADSVRILLDEDAVKAARLDIGQLIRRLASDNFSQPMGDVDDGGREFILRSDMRFKSLEEIENYPIGDGLRIGDVARVERVKSVRDWLTRINGATAHYGMIQKESTANVVEVNARVEKAIDELMADPQLAGKLEILPLFNQANFIKNSLSRLRGTALWGGGLAVLVLFVFLRRVRMTLCVALSIPVSALLAIAWGFFTGGTFNVLTMTGLTLGIGMLVDNSVVVMENIARLKQKGRSNTEAAVEGVGDVGLAVALATLTSVVVFVPLIFMGDNPRMRVMLGALGIPLCMSLVFSLFVALVFLPVISARILGNRSNAAQSVTRVLAPIGRIPVRIVGGLIGLCRRGLHVLLHGAFRLNRLALAVLTPMRWLVAAGIVALVVMQFSRLGDQVSAAKQLEGIGLGSSNPQGQIGGTITFALVAIALLLVGLPRWRRRPKLAPARPAAFVPAGDSILGWLQDGIQMLLDWTVRHRVLAGLFALGALASVTIPSKQMRLTAFGQEENPFELDIDIDMEDNFTLAETSREMARYETFLEGYREEFGFDNLVASFRPGGGEIELRWDQRQDAELFETYRAELREKMPRYAGHRLRFSKEQQVDVASRQFVQFQIRGTDADTLQQIGEEAVAILETVPGLTDVSSPLESAPEQIRLVLDADIAYQYGVTADSALQSVSWALRGVQLPRYHEQGREVPFIIEYDSEDLAGLDTLRNLDVFTNEGSVPLSSFADIQFERGRRSIFRWNGKTTFNIQARVDDPNRQGEIVEAGYAALEALEMPRGYSLGRDTSVLARQEEEMGAIKDALLLSLVLVFLLMGILFESMHLAVSVLTTIPFAVVGALWTLYLTGTTMDSVGWIGVIILVGVVVNNGIVLIDKIHRLRLQGLSRREAVLGGASARVRPILMTALTTVFGLMPMALGEAAREGIDYRALATCVAGGLTVCTFFTLWIVPLAYTVLDDIGWSFGWLVRRVFHRGRLPEPNWDPEDRWRHPATKPGATVGGGAPAQSPQSPLE